MSKPDPSGRAARRAAMEMLHNVLEEGVAVSESHTALERLAGSERARALSLTRLALKHLPNLDAVLKPYLRRAPLPQIHAVLRIGAVELLVQTAAPHGVVHTCVALCNGINGGKGSTGLVNAVLRILADDGPARLAAMQAPRLPGWLRGRLQNAYGDPATRAMEATLVELPQIDITPHRPTDLPDATRLPTGSLRLREPGQLTSLPGYASGDWWVQDAAAALPVKALGDLTGLKVLDLCAAPGGKTLQLAAAGADVTALDISEARLNRLRENLTRTGLSAHVVVADALTWEADTPFDVVVLDAPCSATGTLRRHPELPFIRSATDLKSLRALQRDLLAQATGFVSPGGRLLYITCSLLPEEGEMQVAGLEGVSPLSININGVGPEVMTPEGHLRTRPDIWADAGGMDGFFAALFRRT